MYALTPNTLGGFIYSRSEYNAKGQLTKQYQDTGSGTESPAPTLYEYDNFGNLTKQTLALSATPTKDNSPVVEMAYSVESTDEGVFSVTTNTRYNAEGNPLMSMQKRAGKPHRQSLFLSEKQGFFINSRPLTPPYVRITAYGGFQSAFEELIKRDISLCS